MTQEVKMGKVYKRGYATAYILWIGNRGKRVMCYCTVPNMSQSDHKTNAVTCAKRNTVTCTVCERETKEKKLSPLGALHDTEMARSTLFYRVLSRNIYSRW